MTPRARRNGDPEPAGQPGHPVVDEVELLEELLAQVVEETQPKAAPWFADLRGRGAIVTGAATGIGRAIAIELARHGANIAFNYLGNQHGRPGGGAAHGQRAAPARGHRVLPGVRRPGPDQVKAFVTGAREAMGRVDILVNNAGIGRDRALWRMSDGEWRGRDRDQPHRARST
jgi:hypothetical protein